MGVGTSFGKMRALPMFPLLPDIETFYRAMVSHNPCVNQAFAALLLILLQNQVMLLLYIHLVLNFGEWLKLDRRISDSTRARH